MASQKNFAITPTVSITRSKFVRNSQMKTTIKIGELTPIFLDEVLPGDSRKIDMASLVRMATPVVPIMDNIHLDYYCMYAPSRILWNHWKEFMGENTTSAGIYTGIEYKIPQVDIFANNYDVTSGSLGDHLGLPITAAASGKSCKVSDLPGRMYKIIYNEWFRDQNIIAPINVSLGDTGTTDYGMSLYKAAKDSDYFTRALPYAQKHAPVTIPLGTSAKVKVAPYSAGVGFGMFGKYTGGGTWTAWDGEGESLVYSGTALGGNIHDSSDQDMNNGVYNPNGTLYADLSEATAATINQLRFAFQLQKLYEADCLFGSRYWEILKGHFGVSAPDASLQRPELLGHYRMNINIDQVLQTTDGDTTDPSANGLGNTAAVSCTGSSGNLCTKSFVEHGYIMILAVARHDQTYGQGVSCDWTRSVRTDFYFPEFANLGAKSVLNKEIYAQGTSADSQVFGYQEAWAEYRYKPSLVTGLMRPNVTGLGYWNLANNFASLPTLGQSFIEQGNQNIKRSIGDLGFDFICDFAFKDIAVRPMPLYSIPGLIDHH